MASEPDLAFSCVVGGMSALRIRPLSRPGVVAALLASPTAGASLYVSDVPLGRRGSEESFEVHPRQIHPGNPRGEEVRKTRLPGAPLSSKSPYILVLPFAGERKTKYICGEGERSSQSLSFSIKTPGQAALGTVGQVLVSKEGKLIR